MVRNKSPGIDFQGLDFALRCQAIQKVVPVLIRPEYVGSFYPPCHHMMQCPRSIESRLSRHMPYATPSLFQCQVVFEPTSLVLDAALGATNVPYEPPAQEADRLRRFIKNLHVELAGTRSFVLRPMMLRISVVPEFFSGRPSRSPPQRLPHHATSYFFFFMTFSTVARLALI